MDELNIDDLEKLISRELHYLRINWLYIIEHPASPLNMQKSCLAECQQATETLLEALKDYSDQIKLKET